MRTMYDFPLPLGADWEELFVHFFSLDDVKRKPDQAWYDQVTVLLDKIGRENYLAITTNWLFEKTQMLARNAKKLENYWVRDRMDDIRLNQNPEWVKTVLAGAPLYRGQNPLTIERGNYYFYTLGGRIIRGTIFTNRILQDEKLFDIIDLLLRVSPELYKDILDIYEAKGIEFAVPRLTALRDAIKHKTYKKAIDTAIAKYGGKNNKGGAEMIKERFVPDMGFNQQHQLIVEDGNYAMGIDLMQADVGEIVLMENGGIVAKVPSAVKKNLTAQFKSHKLKHKEIKSHYALQKNRLEEIYRNKREWIYEVWAPYYIAHAVTGALGKNLIWEFSNGKMATSAIFRGDGFVDSQGQKVSWVSDKGTVVKLWHPVTAPASEVEGWRRFCMQHQVKQPFRQAFREVYRANASDEKHADHFEGHVVRENQYNALCKTRGWSCGDYSHQDSSIRLPAFDLAVEFEISDQWSESYSSSGGCLQVTGKVKFREGKQQVRSAKVNPVAFSEVMRDLDMIVTVSGIGYGYTPVEAVMDKVRAYCDASAKRDLSPIGIIRRDILQLLMPQTAISERCSIDGQYLYVRGELASYKIHIGTADVWNAATAGWIHVEPKMLEQTARHFLPDEGDLMLTVILSKANLLAEDHLIPNGYLLSRIKETWK
ncbi:DUF4132 domain-containing protein [Chitinophaga sp. Cy-1792]|uniref:DUF4132 domain-containing protein n=1 Tax=Chitinophaga sp. Cy-1792 TaxID=2608339 RepID=UPI001420F3C2|nr:DUF4132 domain-containing protein [Chitinophaga sp. Cy-1792]NIG54468.1 DUF4132 domain-containing protein [Chitinophaga sp. Cy-1792]